MKPLLIHSWMNILWQKADVVSFRELTEALTQQNSRHRERVRGATALQRISNPQRTRRSSGSDRITWHKTHKTQHPQQMCVHQHQSSAPAYTQSEPKVKIIIKLPLWYAVIYISLISVIMLEGKLAMHSGIASVTIKDAALEFDQKREAAQHSHQDHVCWCFCRQITKLWQDLKSTSLHIFMIRNL